MSPLPVDATTRLVTYTAVVPAPGVIQANLLARAQVWANRVGLPNKPVLHVTELGTDVLVVAGAQPINPSFGVNEHTLYYLARIALREGRYQYRFDEFTLAAGDAQPSLRTAEIVFLQDAPAKATGSSYATRLRKAFEEATGQVAASLQATLTTTLTSGTGADW